MNISIFGDTFSVYFGKELKKEGHIVHINHFSPDVDLLITDGIQKMYTVYKNLKIIKKKKIKFINFILDIPPWRLEKNYSKNTPFKKLRQSLYHFSHKNNIINGRINYFTPNSEKNIFFNFFSKFIQELFNKFIANQTAYLKNYRKILTYADLNLSISKFTQKLVKTNLKIDSEVCYPCVNSDLLLKMPKSKIKYDVINISRIVPHKRQGLIIKAAKKLGLKVIIIGKHQDRSIKLDCPHFFLSNPIEVWKKLSKAAFYVVASEYEGFGMTPIEAAFLDKITIASDIYVHKEVLGDYPLYFKKNNIEDLVDKMKMVRNGDFYLNNVEIKKKYSIQAFKIRLLEFIESIF